MKKFLLTFLISILTFAAFSQGSNSINISILGCGNYSAKLSDYYSPKNAGMLTVIVRNTDFKDPYLQIQLYMSVTNGLKTYIQTKSPNISKTFQLHTGETLTLTGQDLECIFNTYYLNYNKSNFQDGQNILKIYARDTRTGKIVSNTAQILLKSVMIAPPKLTSPDENFTIETDNQFFNFAWRGDNGGANIATRCNYRYKFELWKQTFSDKNVEAQRPADFTMENLFDEKYQFLLATFPFEIGQKYCWRVTAYDPFEKATFLQNGKSEVRSFIFKHLPVPVTGLKHTINERNRQATVTWNAAEGHTKYYVEYYNPQTTKTIAMEKDEPKFTLASAPETEYTILFRVKAQCWGDDSRCSNWSDWDTIKYAAPEIVESKYPCGYQFPKVEITNFELKTDFKEGDIVSEANGSSEYEIINCKSDENGVLEGQFYLIMNAWGGAKIACDFWDTKINTDNVIITTCYRSIDVPGGMIEPEKIAEFVKELWQDGNSLATSSKIKDTIVIDQKFDYLYRRENGDFVAVIVNDDGSTTETDVYPYKTPAQTLITDGQGDSVVVSQKGQVMGIKEYRATGGNRALLNDYHRRSDSLAQWQINFLPDTATQIYGFDYLGSGNHGIYSGSEYYPYLSGNYDLRFKSVECGKTDKVIVDFGSYPERDSVVFKDKWGVKLKVSKGNILNFSGVTDADTNYIYAYRGDEKIGKLSVNTYKPQTKEIEFVRVNGAEVDESITAEALSKIFNCAAVNFKIAQKEIEISDLKPFTHGGSNWHSVYNDDQKKVLEAYDSEMQNGKYYLFFVDGVLDKKDSLGTPVSGYMPRGYNAGFIYDKGSVHTVAHELGHGIAGLEHVFKNSSSSGKTQNLMDYALGEELWHFQWNEIQDPSRVWMKWNKDESEGEWTTDGHYYLFTYLGVLMGMNYADAERLGRYAEEPDSHVFSKEDEQTVIMGDNKAVKVFNNFFVEGDVLPAHEAKLNIHGQYDRYYDKKGREILFAEGLSLYNWGAIKLTAQDIKNGYVDIKDNILAHSNINIDAKRDYRLYFNLIHMAENTTWAIGELQQRNHALSSGYHGVELAVTAYAIKNAKQLGMQQDIKSYLLHRFGDVFAHFKYEGDEAKTKEELRKSEKYTDRTLNEYIGALDNFFKNNVRFDVPKYYPYEGKIFPEDGIYQDGDKFYSTYSENVTKQQIIKFYLTTKSSIKRLSKLDFQNSKQLCQEWVANRDYQEVFSDDNSKMFATVEYFSYYYSFPELKKLLLKVINLTADAKQNDKVMYGDAVTCMSGFTSGHAVDETAPDEILRRSELFMLYVKRAAELLNIINQIEDQSKISYAVKTIQSVVEWGLGAAATQGNNVNVNARLDGVFSFLIECEKHKNDNEFYVYIPIKFLPEEIEEGLASAMYTRVMDWTGFFEWDFTRGATNQRGVLEVYLEEKGYFVVEPKSDNHVTLFDKNNQTPSYIRLKIKKK